MSSAPIPAHTRSDESVDRSDALLSVANVGFDYENARILDEVTLKVDRGEFVALVGPSGCGKSTLLNLISGVLPTRSGAIRTGSRALRGDRLGNVSYMQQKDLLLPWRTVAENSRLGLEFRGVGRAESMAQVEQLSKSFGLADVLDMMPWQLSGGMRQRAALLRAVLPDNPVLLLDEPFGALDAITRRSLQQWLLNVLDTSDKAVVLVTHDVEESILLADRVLVMAPNPGRIIADIDVDLDSSISDADISTTPRFIELKKQILSLLNTQESKLGASQ
jgi:putative hydroxymethylpyrimidine transport system ATP-binding protein